MQYGHKFIGNLSKEGGDHLFISNQSTGARLGVNAQGTNANLYSYEGYGKTTHPAQDDSSTDFLWNQELSDQATGLVYLRHRFYHPQLKRFIKRDDQRNDNRYAYAVANPIAFIDPMGRSAIGDTLLRSMSYMAGIGFAITAAISLFFAIPTAGASLSLDAVGALATNTLGLLSGGAMISGQAAIDYGYKSIGKVIRMTSLMTGTLSLFVGLTLGYISVPNIASYFDRSAMSSESVTSNIAGTMENPRLPSYEATLANGARSTVGESPPSYESVVSDTVSSTSSQQTLEPDDSTLMGSDDELTSVSQRATTAATGQGFMQAEERNEDVLNIFESNDESEYLINTPQVEDYMNFRSSAPPSYSEVPLQNEQILISPTADESAPATSCPGVDQLCNDF